MKNKIKTKKATRSAFKGCAEKIAEQYQLRLENPQDERFKTPTTNAAGRLRIMTYRASSKPDCNGRGKSAKAVGSARPRPNARLFPILLRDVFDRLGKTSKGDRDRLRLIVHELEFAAENRVPPKFLIGFIHQNGGSKGIEQLRAAKSGTRESSTKSSPVGIQTASMSDKTRSGKGQKASRSRVANSEKRRRKNRLGKRLRPRV